MIFFLLRGLFNFSFEADEWHVTAHYMPLTKLSLFNGLITSLTSPILNDLSAGQHNIPIASIIYYLNTRFFGINYPPYAFMSLLLHSINSFLMFLLIKTLLYNKPNFTKNVFGVLGAIFFAFSPASLHTITGAAPFYGQNILSVTFFLLCLIFFKFAFIKKNKTYIYFSVVFIFLSLFTKETSFFLFILLPFMAIIEKRVFPFKFLGKIFLVSLIAYSIVRFVIPNLYLIPEKISDIVLRGYAPKSYSQPTKFVDTGTIVSRDTSIYKNLPGEVLLRTFIFPLRMTGTVFLPRPTMLSITQFITPVFVPTAGLGDSASMLSFSYGPGNFLVVYAAAILIIILCVRSIKGSIKQRNFNEARALSTGLAIILLSALPLVAIIFSFPRWGFDSYFDSRFMYNPSVGAAIVFPFLIFGIGRFISRTINRKSSAFVISLVFLIWLINNMYVFAKTKEQFINRFGSDRREIISQLKNYLPVLPQKTVFYFETDGKSAFGPALPFYTSVPQAIVLYYYGEDPLPQSFLTNPLNGKSQGYVFAENRGLGYYTSKKDVSDAIRSNTFSVFDVYGFYYYGENARLKNITPQLREEMRDYLNETDISQWKSFADPTLKIKFLYPKSSSIKEISDTTPNVIKSLLIIDPKFSATVSFINVSPSFDIHEVANFLNQKTVVIDKDVSFDKYRSNKVTLVQTDNPRYYMRMTNALLQVKTDSNNPENMLFIERILGSFENL